MTIGTEFTAQDHARAPKNRYRIERITNGNVSAVNVVKNPSNRKGGYQPTIYLTPVNIAGMTRLNLIEWHTEAK